MPLININSYSDLSELRNRYPTQTIVLGTGCFDILHIGHLYFLEDARQQGEILVIGVNSDESVRQIKGDKRPIMQEKSRATLVSAFRCVDYTFIYNDTVADDCILNLRPDVFAIGEESARIYHSEIDAARRVSAAVHEVRRMPSVSTTSVVTAILEKKSGAAE